MATRELTLPTTLVLERPDRPFFVSKVRKANYRFGMAEACWMLSGSHDAELIGAFNRNMLNYSDDGETMWGAYGPRLMGQLAHVVSAIRRDPDSRQAIAVTWRPMVEPVWANIQYVQYLHDAGVPHEDDALRAGHPEWDGASWRSKDVPCTVAWHFQLRDGTLQLTVFMRSNDVWLGLPYDILSFTTVQRVVAAMLGAAVGPYIHVVSNLHIYEQHFDIAGQIVYEEQSAWQPTLPAFELDGVSSTTPAKETVMAVRRMFSHVIDEHRPNYVNVPGIEPYWAAIRRDPDVWPDWMRLRSAAGWRGVPKLL